MRNIVRYIILGVMTLVSVTVAADTSDSKSTAPDAKLIFLAPPKLLWQGDSLLLTFSGEMSVRLRGIWTLYVKPVYVSGNDTIHFPELRCFTPSGARYDRRRAAYSYNRAEAVNYIVSRKGDCVDYRAGVLVPSTMNGRLILTQELRDCCDSWPLTADVLSVPLRNGAVAQQVGKADATGRYEYKEGRERTDTIVVRLTYPVDQWRVYPDFRGNEAELHRIDRLMAPVATDTATYHILSAKVIGYASPEGKWEHNKTLSANRAKGMCSYLQARYGIPAERFTAEGRGEDWDGLREAVAGSDMKYRNEVLAVIDGCSIFAGREKKLMDLRGGAPYKYMLNNLFPPLRRMEILITYRVHEFIKVKTFGRGSGGE